LISAPKLAPANHRQSKDHTLLPQLWGAFGERAQDEIKQQTETWFKKMWEKATIIVVFLRNLYETADLETELSKLVNEAPNATDAGKFNQASRKLGELLGRYSTIKTVLQWVMRVMSWNEATLLAAQPWDRLVHTGFMQVCSGMRSIPEAITRMPNGLRPSGWTMCMGYVA
jgi:hypothetical protein